MRCPTCGRIVGHEEWCSEFIKPLDGFKPLGFNDEDDSGFKLPPLKPIRDLPEPGNFGLPDPTSIPNQNTGTIRNSSGADMGFRIWDDHIIKDMWGAEIAKIEGNKVVAGEGVQIGTVSQEGHINFVTDPFGATGAEIIDGIIKKY